MAITYEQVKTLAAELYGGSLKKIPEDTKGALRDALATERQGTAPRIASRDRAQ